MKTKPTKCLFPKCTAPVKLRGVCFNHYMLVRRAIYKNGYSDKQFVDNKLILPSTYRGADTPASIIFAEALKKIK